ncbi:cyclophilin-like fold protein [Paenibacillus sp. BIC5C1]|uniref:cyclophilin-like fold protein n=1 Tax=Paenibacillus sp. BIC5C1 TaxID=3078263 RepID=UPI0037CBE92D
MIPPNREFLSRLPLTLSFEDYNRTEKNSYLPHCLTTEEAPGGFDPSVGDLTLYAPWGNLAVFYMDFGATPAASYN